MCTVCANVRAYVPPQYIVSVWIWSKAESVVICGVLEISMTRRDTHTIMWTIALICYCLESTVPCACIWEGLMT